MHTIETRGQGGWRSIRGWRALLWGGAAGVLLLPALAMRFYPQAGVDWSPLDFAVMGVLLAAVCGLLDFGLRRDGSPAYRAGFAVAVLAGFATIWANLAVGMLGGEGDPANALFAGVLAIAAVGSLRARFRAAGMAKAMAATACAHLAVVGVALALGGFLPRELLLTACFSLPWLLSAGLFRRAAR